MSPRLLQNVSKISIYTRTGGADAKPELLYQSAVRTEVVAYPNLDSNICCDWTVLLQDM